MDTRVIDHWSVERLLAREADCEALCPFGKHA